VLAAAVFALSLLALVLPVFLLAVEEVSERDARERGVAAVVVTARGL
jgi:hypothetical protein